MVSLKHFGRALGNVGLALATGCGGGLVEQSAMSAGTVEHVAGDMTSAITFEAPAPVDLFDAEVWSPGSQLPDPDFGTCTKDDPLAKQAWTTFREKHPFHAQTVALSPPFPSGCRTLIIAEPPPGTTLEQLKALNPRVLGHATTERKLIGADGWVQDAVFLVPPLKKTTQRSIISAIHLQLFGTSYRADTEWPAPATITPTPPTPTLDLAVRPNELLNWVAESTGEFVPVEGGPPTTGRALLSHSSGAIYTKPDDGLVVWALPRDRSASLQRAAAREFFLESDLIVGAMASPQTLLIVARQRSTPESILRPLRFETVNLLTETRSPELAQSYERRNAFAGFFDAPKEWAPILLSPELVDTEYGSLLNITDQILKGWSNAGETSYVRFSCPLPKDWPFKKSIYEMIGGDSLVYNWNTHAAGAAVQVDDLDIFSLRRTGALNVTYLPDESGASLAAMVLGSNFDATRRAQEFATEAHEAFAKSGDPNLTRVVQYNALYQIFRHFKFGSGSSTDDPFARSRASKAIVTRLAPVGIQLLNALRGAPDNALEKISRDFMLFVAKAQKPGVIDPSHFDATVDAAATDMTKELMEIRRDAQRLSSAELSTLGVMLAGERLSTVLPNLDDLHLRIQKNKFALQHLLNVDSVIKSYSGSFPAATGSWVHTPSVVISWSGGSMRDATGGHNLNSAINQARVRRADINRIRLDGEGIETHAPATPPRAPRLALQLAEDGGWKRSSKPEARVGFAQKGHVKTGWRVSSEGVHSAQTPHSISVERTSDAYLVRFADEGRAVEALSMVDVIDVLERFRPSRGDPISVELKRFSPDEARGFSVSMELSQKGRFSAVMKENSALARERLDFSRAKVFEPAVRKLPDGSAEVALVMQVPTVITKKSIWYRVKIFVKNATHAQISEAVAAVRTAVSRVFARISGESPAADVGKQIRQELEILLPGAGTNFEIKLRGEASDVLIVRFDGDGADGRARSLPT